MLSLSSIDASQHALGNVIHMNVSMSSLLYILVVLFYIFIYVQAVETIGVYVLLVHISVVILYIYYAIYFKKQVHEKI